MENIDWVGSRSKLTRRALFEQIATELERDVEQRRNQTAAKKIVFAFRRAGDLIDVVRFKDGEMKETSVTFHLTAQGIESKDHKGNLIAITRPTLTLGSGSPAVYVSKADGETVGPVDEWVFRFISLQALFGFDEEEQ